MSKNRRFEALVNAYSTDLYRYAYWLSGNKAVAEDVVQEAFLRAWKALDSLEDGNKAKSWLITIVRREHARLYERITPDFVDIHDLSLGDDRSLSPEEQTERKLMYQAVAELEVEYREPLLLQVMGGFKGDEIAEILKLNRNTVSTRLHRARKQVKDKLESKQPKEAHNG